MQKGAKRQPGYASMTMKEAWGKENIFLKKMQKRTTRDNPLGGSSSITTQREDNYKKVGKTKMERKVGALP